MKLRGQVFRRLASKGSKSEREVVIVKSGDAEYILRRRGSNPFADIELNSLVGKQVEFEGMLHGCTFLIDSYSSH